MLSLPNYNMLEKIHMVNEEVNNWDRCVHGALQSDHTHKILAHSGCE